MNVVVFGASRSPNAEDRQLAFELGIRLGAAGHVVVNGGGPGLMDETLRGAKTVHAKTHGVRLEKQGRVHSVHADQIEHFHKLWDRQKRLIGLGDAYIALPGGIGTFYELFEVLALKNAHQMNPHIPLILLGRQIEAVKTLLASMIHYGYAAEKCWAFISFAQDLDECMDILARLPETGSAVSH
ncbi:MAG: LOG family protein [Acidobacteria bacterium]|nr:LOG family protein [Acidobacteriota bacterium]MCB9398057.1 LOG family protein [Acidobacteriota bacterium]